MRRLTIIFCLIIASCGPGLATKKNAYDNFDPDAQGGGGSSSEGQLKIVIFDVGEGDSTLVVSPEGEAILIDTGPPGSWDSRIKPYLSTSGNIYLKHLIITHDDSDHNGDVLQTGLPPEEISAGDVIYLGSDVQFSVLAKDCKFKDGSAVPCDQNDDNAHSVVMLISYGSFRYLTTGDLPGGGGNPPYDTIDLETKAGDLAGDVDILHCGHHGSNTSTNENFLESTKPEIVIISAGDKNDYWHPHLSVIERLLASGIEVYLTERGWLKEEFLDSVTIADGDIMVESDGSEFSLSVP